MLNLLLSHWMTYMYLFYVVLLVVLCVVFRPRSNANYWKLRNSARAAGRFADRDDRAWRHF
jgi:hypothetical protein